MKRILRAVTMAALLVAAASSQAQEGTKAQIGFGVGVDVFNFNALGAGALAGVRDPRPTNSGVSFTVPINLGVLKLEPELGYWSYDLDGGELMRRSTIGVGAFYVMKPAPTAFYAGGRLGFAFNRVEIPGLPAATQTDWRLAAVFGAEHFVVAAFSVGAEAQFGYYNVGENTAGGLTVDRSASVWQTNGSIYLRYYFN